MNHHLRVNRADEKMILVFGTHFSAVRDTEKVELLVGGPRSYDYAVRWSRCFFD
jgi:hypothetical protein